MPPVSGQRRAPLEDSSNMGTHRSISASFRGTKASISSKSRKPSHRKDYDDSQDEDMDEEDDDGADDSFDGRAPSSKSKSYKQNLSKSHSRQPSLHHPQQQQQQQAALRQSKAGGAPPNFNQGTRVAALARSHAAVNMGDASILMPQRNTNRLEPTAPPAIRVDTSSFEEWMKMATDNKINSTNTWSFALIDYFHDMSLLRNDSGDGSINFQKASCTLDGCVKVWTSRVDSVVVETGKLLSGLQDEINADKAKEKRGRGDEDGDDDDLDDEDDDEDQATGTTGKTRKRSKNKEATLAKNFSQIQAKKFDLEFTVDPLFKKTSADFDEGGAGGLLMNHLGVDSNVRVVFDASDVAGVGDDADDDAGADEDEQQGADVEPEMVDLSKLRAKLFGYEDGEDVETNINALLGGRVICPTLCNFSFSENDNTPFGVGLDHLEDQSFEGFHPDQQGFEYEGFQDDDMVMPDDDQGGDFFAGTAAAAGSSLPMSTSRARLAFDGDEDGMMGGADDDDGGDFFDAPEPGQLGPMNDLGGGAGYSQYGQPAAPNQHDMVMALAFNNGDGAGDNDDNGNGEGGLFDYFDRRLMRNWAGPEHWKMSRVASAPLGAAGVNAKKDETRAVSGTTSRKSKEPFVIDFLSEEAAVNVKEIFEPAKNPATLCLPSTSRAKLSLEDSSSKDAYLLPEDRHFSSKQLLKLFLKPRAAINLRRRRQGESDLDGRFWAQAAGGDGMDGFDGGAGMPYETQYFNDNDDGFDPMLADGGMADGSPESNLEANNAADLEDDDMLQTMAALNRVKPEYVNYAKKAKRVDIKKLKENIWSELGILTSGKTTSEGQGEEGDGDETMDGTGPATPKASAQKEFKTFDTVLSGLKKAYPKDKMEEISTSFCFICLLHLANEEGLEISTGNEQLAGKKRRLDGRKSGTPTPVIEEEDIEEDGMGAMLKKLANGGGGARIVTSNDDDAGGEDWEEDEEDEVDSFKVGKLESLRIAKDPKAGRSA